MFPTETQENTRALISTNASAMLVYVWWGIVVLRFDINAADHPVLNADGTSQTQCQSHSSVKSIISFCLIADLL